MAAGLSQRVRELLPVLPLKNAVVYPYIILPLSIGRDGSMAAVESALGGSRQLLFLAQRSPEIEEPGPEDLHALGTIASILRMLRLPDGQVRILAQGLSRARVERLQQGPLHLTARVRPLADAEPSVRDLELEARMRAVKQSFDRIVELGREVSPEVVTLAANLTEPGRLADLLASNLDLSVEVAQQLLEELDPVARLERISELLRREEELLALEQTISNRAREELDRTQREYFLRQQLRAIQVELGEGEELAEEARRLRQQAAEKGMSEAGREELERQLRRLERAHPDSAEANVQRAFLEWLVSLPWAIRSEDRLDLEAAREVLEEDHWGLQQVKERILETLAVRRLRPQGNGAVLCLVGPPGVGKSSLARSIARALGRQFVRWSLGGVHDEAEVRGHRRTYVGALPGRILQGLVQAGTSNPVFLLDELDKLGKDLRGDPQAALLEILDPELNRAFRDHYLGVPYDLSGVFWIATANWLEPLHPALRDRLEVLEIPAYSVAEKVAIARRHLLPRQLEQNGLKASSVRIGDAALRVLIEDYTREAGVRQLERQLETLARKLAFEKVAGRPPIRRPGARSLRKWLGPPRLLGEELPRADRVGVAVGLAWTPLGGELLLVEAMAHPGKGKLILTGHLGEVLRESAQAAVSLVRTWAVRNGYEDRYFLEQDLHLHFPSGGIPKDGPSAGLAIGIALISLRTGRKVPRRIAWTGEITLRGEVLPVGGLREKLLAAQGSGIETVVLPASLEREWKSLPADVSRGLATHFVQTLEEAVALLLPRRPTRLPQVGSSRNRSRPGHVRVDSRTGRP